MFALSLPFLQRNLGQYALVHASDEFNTVLDLHHVGDALRHQFVSGKAIE